MRARALGWRGALPLLVAISLGILAACAGEEATPTPTATATLAPGQTPTAATPTPTATQPPMPTGGPVYGGILNLAMENDAPSLSPGYDTSITRSYLWWPMYDRLWSADFFDMRLLVNDLVESYEYLGDGSQISVTLRSGVQFHDGTPLTSSDITARYEINQCNVPAGRSNSVGVFAQVLTNYPDRDCADFLSDDPTYGIKIVDDLHFIFKLSRPSNEFLNNVYTDAVAPRHVLFKEDLVPREQGHEDTLSDNIGTGAFMFDSYARGAVFKVTRNPNYFKTDPRNGNQLPYLDAIQTFIIPDASTRFAAFRNGAVEVTQDNFRPITFSQGRVIETQMQGKATVFTEDGSTNAFLSFNHLRKPYDDVRVRQALFLAIDRDDLCEVLAEGHCVYATHLPPIAPARFGDALKDLPGYRQPKTEDIAEANRLLDAAGLPRGSNGVRITTELPIRPTSRYQDLGLMLQDQLRAIGVELRLNPMELVAFDRRRSARDFDLLPITGVKSTLDPLGGNSSYWAFGNGYNCEDAERDALHQTADTALPGSAAYIAAVQGLEQRLLDIMCAWTPTLWLDYPLGIWNHVHDYTPHVVRYDVGVAAQTAWKDPGT